MQPVIETQRLILRPFRLSDSERVALLAGNQLVSHMTANIPYPYTVEMASEWIKSHTEKFEQRSAVIFAITIRGNDSIVGAVSFPSIKGDLATLGYWIGCEHWGQGITLEAAKALISYAKRELNVAELEVQHLVENRQSCSVIKKLGMQYKEKRKISIKGQTREVCSYNTFL
ncbi:GNAT family N-acetyltransferase [Vibrio hepatarius]|uniref:GNAT family N-acetyltransferase n=1 Tax=Vibrio hepatarius TaxID=171383 RepID=UPI001C098FBC|nr:GNAT family N-acetyltransferase [Vibrio hepatarius]MBU2899268.1 GNAT family N-acetyltransferase [Vibrio hepatarius]